MILSLFFCLAANIFVSTIADISFISLRSIFPYILLTKYSKVLITIPQKVVICFRDATSPIRHSTPEFNTASRRYETKLSSGVSLFYEKIHKQ